MNPIPIISLLALSACAARQMLVDPEPVPALDQSLNLLENASFEGASSAPWYDFSERSKTWYPFEISGEQAHSGSRAAKLTLSDTLTTPTAIFGVVQEPAPRASTIPERLSGYYRVSEWTRSTKNQYLQAVIMATRPANKPDGTNFPTYQIAIPLTGITEPPFTMANRRFVFGPGNTPTAEPALDEWIPFAFDVRSLFMDHWGFIPEGSSSYRIFFEVRYDKKADDEHPAATVYYDDLYFGPDPEN